MTLEHPENGRRRAERALLETPAAELAARRLELHAQARASGLTPDEIFELIAARNDLPRPLLPEERAALMAVLDHTEAPERTTLLAQADATQVESLCGCGCASVALLVDRGVPAAAGMRSPLDEVMVVDETGEPLGGLLLFLDGGYLSHLEIYYYGDDPISPFPPRERLVNSHDGRSRA